MATLAPRADLRTHEVLNQPLPRGAGDLWADDMPLRQAAQQAGAQTDLLARAGALYSSAQLQNAAHEARRDPPRLQIFARSGHRLDEVAFNSGYHDCMAAGLELGYAAVAWEDARRHQESVGEHGDAISRAVSIEVF